MHSTQIDSKSNLSFSFHRERSFIGDRYSRGWERCHGWDLIARAVLWGAWSPCIWEKGTRSKANFIYSDFLGLDIDNGLPIAEAVEMFRDTVHIIGTTRNHQREKKGVVADRYRIIIPWESRITCRREFESSLAAIGKKIDADSSGYDAARVFWPCASIVSKIDPGPDWELATVTAPEPKREYEQRTAPVTGIAEPETKTYNFVKRGVLWPNYERADSIFRSSLDLFRCGYDHDTVLAMIAKAPFNRNEKDGREFNFKTHVDGAWKYFRKHLETP